MNISAGPHRELLSQIGLIMLVRLVTKNRILIVEVANQRRQVGGVDALLAVRDAAGARLRPILMTTLATILGIGPIALASGAGAESRSSMGIAGLAASFWAECSRYLSSGGM